MKRDEDKSCGFLIVSDCMKAEL